MYCPECGKEIPDQSKFCFKCGADLKQSLGDITTQVQSKSDVSIETLSDASTILGIDLSSFVEARYEILSTIGQGGMGTVYKARDKKLERNVAIKRLLTSLSTNEKAFTRFLSEAKSLASLNHPNVVHIYDVDEDSDGHYISMEFIEEGSLHDVIKKKGKLDEQEALEIFINICKGLGQAHKKGIIHRDIKPANILINSEGTPKLTDFGIAQMAEAEDMTKTGIAMGTPIYISPEQLKDAKNVDQRTDIYSLGATLYEMLTGQSPRVIHMERLPEKFRGIVGKMLKEQPEERFNDIDDILRDAATIRNTLSDVVQIIKEERERFEPEMVLVNGGEFEMGDVFGDGDECEKPVHRVSLDDFSIGKYPVTFDEYDLFCEATGIDKPNDRGWGRVRRPVMNVSFENANKFIEWLNSKTNGGYRLPTEAEWEYAARSGGKKEKWAGTSNESEIGNYAWYDDNSGKKTHPVGQKKPNGLGIYDMSGNVWEWVVDWYDNNYYGSSPERNPGGPDSGTFRVLRGSSFYYNARFTRISFRYGGLPHHWFVDYGFRCARTI